LYVIATPPTAELAGFHAAEFRIEVMNPSGYFFVFTPTPDALVLGNPLDLTPEDSSDPAGIQMVINTCQTADRVRLGTITVVNVVGGPTELWVMRHSRPPNPVMGNCPLFTDCDPPYYTIRCMRPCDVDATGSAIAGRGFLNTAECAPAACATACPGTPCVSLASATSPRGCPGEPVTITATATNCGSAPADIDLFVDDTLAGSFTDVFPAQSVTASHTFIPLLCPGYPDFAPHFVGGVAHNDECVAPFGAEVYRPTSCRSDCANNRPPDCSKATASIELLWPPDGTLRDVSVQGVTDPDGEPVQIAISVIDTDEPTGIQGEPNCPDAILDGANAVRLRAERNPQGNGRVYRLTYRATDPQFAECNETVTICVPRKLEANCIAEHFGTLATVCDPFTGRRSIQGPTVLPIDGGHVAVRFEMPSAGDAEIIAYDMRGRRVKELVHGRFTSGIHLATWDGTNTAGVRVAAGIYAVRVRLGTRTESVKVVLSR